MFSPGFSLMNVAAHLVRHSRLFSSMRKVALIVSSDALHKPTSKQDNTMDRRPSPSITAVANVVNGAAFLWVSSKIT